MGESMNHYELLEPFQNKNAGFSKWTFAVRRDKKYFLKEFLDPVYPTEESLSAKLRQLRIDDCEEFETKRKKLYEAINAASDGNLVRIFEFFRYDNHYYIATERIIGQTIPLQLVTNVPFEKRIFLCKSIAHSIRGLHREHIVHADIKDNNIMIKQTKTGRLVGKVIDFDAGFFEWDPPTYEDDLGGDQVYLAPEACQFICGDPVKLTTKIDVFSLGLLFHQYLTGELPAFDLEEYDYAFDAVLDGQTLGISQTLPYAVQKVLQGMLVQEPEERLSMEEVYAVFDAMDEKGYLDTVILERLISKTNSSISKTYGSKKSSHEPILIEELADAGSEGLEAKLNEIRSERSSSAEETSAGIPEDVEEDSEDVLPGNRMDMPMEEDEDDPLSAIRAKYFFSAGDL